MAPRLHTGHVVCPTCGYTVGLGVASEPGSCPDCDEPLMLTTEMRALTPEQVRGAIEAQAAGRRDR
jgi:rubrerythrin